MKKLIIICAVVCLLVFLSVKETQAAISYFSFTDPIGDHTGIVDVVNMSFTFDDTTGNYEAVLTADAANPFDGDFRINLNLFNPDTGTTAENPSFFQDAFNDYSLTTPTLTMTLVGTNSRLTAWEVGDRVATTHIPFGNPDGSTAFRTSVANLPFESWGVSEDIIAEGGFTNIEAIPAPGAILLGSIGVSLVGWLRRRRAL